MELRPLRELAGFQGGLGSCRDRTFFSILAGVVMGAAAFGSIVMTGKVDEFTANVQGGEIEKVWYGFGYGIVQGPAKPNRGVLENIVGLLPPCDARIGLQHFSCEAEQAVAGAV